MRNLDLSKLADKEVLEFRSGLIALSREAESRGIHLVILDIKDKRSGPVVSFDADGDEDGLEDIFERAMALSRSVGSG